MSQIKKKSKKKKSKRTAKLILQTVVFVFLAFSLYSIMHARAVQIRSAEEEAIAAEAAYQQMLDEQAAAAAATPEPQTAEPTPEPTPVPEPEYFTISCIGDLTLTTYNWEATNVGYTARMNGDYSYPFRNTHEYFDNDEFTIGNLECSFSDTRLTSAGTMYSFLCPSDWINILPLGGVDFVTTANNHTMDFYEQGAIDTCAALDSIGFSYGVENQAQIVESPSGIKIGIYTAGQNAGSEVVPNTEKCLAGIAQLKDMGAEYIICMFHWGLEINYDPNPRQIELGKACIDAGADLIYGTHSHCLQPAEEYNGGYIIYSMGNFSFGGNTVPTDPDTAIIQVTIKRDIDGTITNEGIDAIPCCVSSNIDGARVKADHYNDFCPTPYEEGSEEFERVWSKLTGQSGLGNPGRDYSDVWASRG